MSGGLMAVTMTHSTAFIDKKARRKRKERCIAMPSNRMSNTPDL
jgi:hypothetical protein